MLYLKRQQEKRKKGGKKILCRKARVKLTYSKRYKTLQNIVHRGRGLHYFVTWRPMPLKKFLRRKSAKLPYAARVDRQPGRQAGRQGVPVTALPPQASSYFWKTENFINSIYSNNLFYAQGTDQPAQLSWRDTPRCVMPWAWRLVKKNHRTGR